MNEQIQISREYTLRHIATEESKSSFELSWDPVWIPSSWVTYRGTVQESISEKEGRLMDSHTPIDVYSDVTFERLLWLICPQEHCLKSDRPCIISWCLISTLHYQALYHILRIDLSDARPSLLTRAFLWFSLFSWESTGLELLTIQVPFTTLFSWKTR